MSRRHQKQMLTGEEISSAFEGKWADRYPPHLTHDLAAEMLGISASTLYEWKAKGRLKGCCRQRGKHNFFWRDKLIDTIYNGKEWA